MIILAKIAICTSFSGLVADFLSNVQGSLMVLHCLLAVAKGVIILAEIAIATSFSCPVADFLSNALVLLVLRKCLLVIA